MLNIVTDTDNNLQHNKVLQVLAIDFVPLANEFVLLANEFLLLANKFIPLATEFDALALALEFVTLHHFGTLWHQDSKIRP